MTADSNEKKTEDSIELSLDDLEGAAGGYVVNQGRYYSGDSQFVIVDDNTGDVRASTRSMINATRIALEQEVRPQMITSDRYKELFGKEI